MRRTVPSTEQPSNTSDNVGGIRVVDSARKACPSLRKLWCDGGFKNAFAAAEAWVHHKALALLDGKAWIVAAAIRRKHPVVTSMFKVSALLRKLRRKPEPAECAIRITLS